MKQIYNFEHKEPPALNENTLLAERDKRRLNRQTALLAAAALLFHLAAALFGYSALDWYPGLSLLCFAYVIVSATGCGVIAVMYSRKGGITL